MRRRLLNVLTALSLLLFVAACALWVRSYYVGEAWHGTPRFEQPAPGERLALGKGWVFHRRVGSGAG